MKSNPIKSNKIKIKIKILSYWSDGRLDVLLGDKKYTYYYVSKEAYEKLEQMLKKNNIKKAFAILKAHSIRSE